MKVTDYYPIFYTEDIQAEANRRYVVGLQGVSD